MPTTLAGEHGRRVRHPEAVVGGDVDHVAAALDGALEGGGVREVPHHGLAQPVDQPAVAARAGEQAERVASGGEGAGDGRADEARAARDESGS